MHAYVERQKQANIKRRKMYSLHSVGLRVHLFIYLKPGAINQ